jgi:threonine dehydratase
MLPSDALRIGRGSSTGPTDAADPEIGECAPSEDRCPTLVWRWRKPSGRGKDTTVRRAQEKSEISLCGIEAALGRIRDSVYLSPLVRSETFSRLTGNQIFFKLENLQMTGSFKERGALNKILTLTEQERRQGVIAASAGNHAQAVSYHATKRGIRAEICMPVTTPLVKVLATQEYGAEVILHGSSYDEACDEALRRSGERELVFLHPFDDPEVIAGQGTLGLEMFEQNPGLDAVVVPIGGGGLAAGIAVALKSRCPRMQVFGVQTQRIPSMQVAIREGRPVTLPPAGTIADGIAVRRAGERTLAVIRDYLDGIVTVEEEEIAKAILLLLEREKMLAEGAGAVSIAALLHDRIPLRDKKIGVLVCGGNIDVTLLARIIERGLVKDGRLLRLRFQLPDFPGSLHRLTGLIAECKANIVETHYEGAYHGVSLGDSAVDVTMETRGREHASSLMESVSGAGFAPERIH